MCVMTVLFIFASLLADSSLVVNAFVIILVVIVVATPRTRRANGRYSPGASPVLDYSSLGAGPFFPLLCLV
jgi:hypothetical protein